MREAAVDLLIEQNSRVAREQARLLELVSDVASAAPVPEFAAVEVAFALTWTRNAAEATVMLAADLRNRLPAVLAAMHAGEIDLPKGRVFSETLCELKPDAARAVAAEVLPVAPSKTTGQLRELLRRRALATDPEFTVKRRQRAEANRQVQLHNSGDGTATFVASGLTEARVAAAFDRITAIAMARKQSGDTLGLDALRADVMLELLEGKHEPFRKGVIHLSVSLETLAELAHDPGTIGGYGPVAADIARQWAREHPGYTWQYGIHGSDGELLQQGLTRTRPSAPSPNKQQPATSSRQQGPPTARPSTSSRQEASSGVPQQPAASDVMPRPPQQNPGDRFANAATTRWIRLRDKTCRAPGCRVPAHRCDIDHLKGYAKGGQTVHDELAAFCRHHHRGKDEGGWRVIRSADGRLRWISPSGHIYDVWPEPP